MLYGLLRATNNTSYQVIRGIKTVMEIQGSSTSLSFIVLLNDGTEAAAASKTTDTFDGKEHLEFRVEPGIDAVLILLCILGIILVIPPTPD